LEAYKIGAPEISATVVIELIDKAQLTFDELFYSGRLDNDQNLIMEEIELNDELSRAGVNFNLADGQSQFFEISQNSTHLRIIKTLSIPENYLENLKFLWFHLEASGDDFHPATTLILIDVPNQTINPPIDECYDTLDPNQPYFETGSYSFTIMNDERGFIGRIKAILVNEISGLSYALLFEDAYLFEKLSISGGDFIVREFISTGIYQMTARAVNLDNQKSAVAKITLRVLEAKTCVNGTEIIPTTIEKALAIEQIDENTSWNKIFYAKVKDCTYEIDRIVPNVFRGKI
jgi:hypothetical protein